MLGIGLNIEYYDNGDISYLHPACLDFISYKSFHEHEVRMSAWKTPFTHWLPLYISADHAGDLRLHEKCISLICQDRDTHKTQKNMDKLPFSYHMVIKVLPVLMNTFIVIFMNGSLHESIAALSSYMQIYRLLLKFSEKYPEIRQEVDNRIKNFIVDEDSRLKRVIPSLGELLPLLSISSFTWNDVARSLLGECFDRNVKWLLKDYPELGKLHELKVTNIDKIIEQTNNEQELKIQQIKLRRKCILDYEKKTIEQIEKDRKTLASHGFMTLTQINNKSVQISVDEFGNKIINWVEIDYGRLPKTFKGNNVSLKLIMFHVYFLQMFRPLNLPVDVACKNTAELLDKQFGRASHGMEIEFQNQVKYIQKVHDWKSFCSLVCIPSPSHEYLLGWLRRSVLNSLRKRYHNTPSKQKKINVIVKQKIKPTLNTDDL